MGRREMDMIEQGRVLMAQDAEEFRARQSTLLGRLEEARVCLRSDEVDNSVVLDRKTAKRARRMIRRMLVIVNYAIERDS